MQTPHFTDPQFVDADGTGGLNAAFGTVSGSIATTGSGAWAAPGILAPEAMTVSFSGLVATIGLPRPWGLVSSGGSVVRAHGTATNQDTTTYTVDFAPVVPGAGTVTAYLAAAVAAIQQNPIPIPGPPPGHPSYDPNFAPTVGYATDVLTVSLSATTGAVDSVTSFELLRTTLSVGQTSVSTWNTGGVIRATPRAAKRISLISSGGAFTADQAQFQQVVTVQTLTNTLPSAQSCTGLSFFLTNASIGDWTISAADSIYGLTGGAVNSFVIATGGSAILFSNGSNWYVLDVAPVTLSHLNNIWQGTNVFAGVLNPGGQLLAVSGNVETSTHMYSSPTMSGPTPLVAKDLAIPTLADFTVSGVYNNWTLTIPRYPAPIYMTTFATGVPAGGGLQSTVITVPPGTQPGTILDASIHFNGNSPPGASDPGSIAIEAVGNATQVRVTTNYANTLTLGVTIKVWGKYG